jgi:SSS family solute:Na+ symporter
MAERNQRHVHPFDFAIIAAYLAAIIFMGFRLSQRVHDARDYFLAGRSLTWVIIGLSIIGTNVSAEGYVGAAGGAYNSGIAQANFEWIGAIPAMILASLIFIPLYWRSGVYSIPEYLGRRYNQPVRVLAALIASIFAIFAIGVALWAIALTLQSYLDWPIWVGIVVMGTVVGLYSISGGLAAVAFTDALQVVIMFLGGVAIVALGISDTGGIRSFADTLIRDNPTHLHVFLPADDENFPWPAVILGLAIVLSPAYWCGGQAILQRTLGARTQWDASASMMFAAFAKTLVPLLIVFPGLLALVMHAEIEYPDMALPWVVKNVLPPGLSGLMFVAIIAALQSSIDSSINSTALMITRDVRGVITGRADPQVDLRIGRQLTLVVLLLGMGIAPFVGELGGIYVFIQSLLSLFQGPMLALLVLGAFTRHVTPRAGLITLVSGVAVSGVLMALGINMLYVAFIAFLYSLLALWLLSYLTERLPESELTELVYQLQSRTGSPGETI